MLRLERSPSSRRRGPLFDVVVRILSALCSGGVVRVSCGKIIQTSEPSMLSRQELEVGTLSQTNCRILGANHYILDS